MKIAFVYSDTFLEFNSSNYRCLIPAKYLEATGHQVERIWIERFVNGNADTQLANCDVILIERNLFGGALPQMRKWIEQGKLVVADFDDPYDMLTPTYGLSYQLWTLGLGRRNDGSLQPVVPHPIVQFRQGLKIAQLTTTPCQRLCDDWQPWANHVRCRPNYLDWPLYEAVQRQPHDGIWIGWGGSDGHLESFARSGVLPALRRVLLARPEVKLLIYGLTDRISNYLPGLPADRFLIKDWVKADKWPQEMAQFDLGLAPLGGAYDERRSCLKIVEYAACGVPWIASDFPNYRGTKLNGVLVQNTPADWERAILWLLDHLAEEQAAAQARRPLVEREWSMAAHVEELVSLFQDELDAFRQAVAAPVKVSVIIPAYNMADYLAEAVSSVAEQTFQGWEAIIVDDGSTDGTARVMDEIKARYPLRRIKLIHQPNSGVEQARNAGIDVADGEFILPLDADDLLIPEALEKLLAVFEADPDLGLVYPDYVKLGLEAGTIFSIPTEDFYKADRPLNGLPYCSMYRKSAWAAAGGYDVTMHGTAEDWDFWLAMLEAGVKAKHLNEPVFAYRVRADSLSVKTRDTMPDYIASLKERHPKLFAEKVAA